MKSSVNPIPKGYHSVTPYIIVKKASQAIEFYIKALGAQEIMRFSMPNNKIAHAEIEINGSRIMIADENLERGAQSPEAYGGSPISLHLYVENVDKMVQQAVNAGAEIERKPEDMFYGDRIASIKDPFGHQWYISTHIKDVSPEEMEALMKASMDKGKCPLNSEN